MAKPPTVASFKGLNNTTDPMNLGPEWLTVADNVDIDARGKVAIRQGFEATPITDPQRGAYATRDESRMYLAGADLVRVHDDLSTSLLMGALAPARMYWAEVNGLVYFTNGTDSGVITQDDEVLPLAIPVPMAPTLRASEGDLPAGLYRVACTVVMPDGREGPAGDIAELQLLEPGGIDIEDIPLAPGWVTRVYMTPADSTVLQLAVTTSKLRAVRWNNRNTYLGRELTTDNLLPLPPGCTCLEFHQGRLVAAQYDSAQDITVLWRSEPMAPHLFDPEACIAVPGEVVGMADAGGTLVIGTPGEVWSFGDDSMQRLANYGMVPGWPITRDKDGRLLMWTARGVCTALPFQNLTQQTVSVPPGLQVGTAVINANGQERFIALLHAGGLAFNPRNPS